MTSTTVSPTINVRPSGLVGLLLAAVILTAAVTWFLTDLALDTTHEESRSAAPASITVTPEAPQAAWAGIYEGRTVAISAERARDAASLAGGVTVGATSADSARAAATLAAGVTPAAVSSRSLAAVTPEELHDAWAGLTAGSTLPSGSTAVTPQAGVGGAGAFITPSVTATISLVAGSTGVAD